MKKLLICAIASCLSVNASAFEPALDVDLNVWVGYLDFEDDDVDVSEGGDPVAGIGIDVSTDRSKKLFGTLSVDYENTLDESDDGDQTIYYAQLSYVQSITLNDGSWIIRPYIGFGQSEDNGDNDTGNATDYSFFGLGVTKNLGDLDVDVQLGKIESSDDWGETIDDGVFGGVTLYYQLNNKFAFSGRLFRLEGDRLDDPKDTKTDTVAIGAQYSPSDLPLTFWVNIDYTDYDPDESDTPNIVETRLGFTYHFGKTKSMSSHRYLPSIGRWVSMYANEIE